MTAVVIPPSIIVTPTALLIGNHQTRSIKIVPKPEANTDQAYTPKAKIFLFLVPLRGSQKSFRVKISNFLNRCCI